MILLKHNAIENFSSFTRREKEDLIVQELSKAFMLYPRAAADILDTCSIPYQSTNPKDLAEAIEKGHDDLKMLNRIVRLSFLVNRQGDNTLENHRRNIRFRSVMREGKSFLETHREVMKEATLIARDMMRNGMFTKSLSQSVHAYAALDGSGTIPSHNEERTRVTTDVVQSTKSNMLYWLLGAAVIGGLVYWFVKRNQNNPS